MDEPLFEIENWRGNWYYKFGSRYTGPFHRHDDAIAAATRDLVKSGTCHRIPLRVSLARVPSFSDLG
ncbi:hypothetical protein IMCC20628_02936 [Hoeflea sp. IMCC20628]|uniref:hypothetical protein n=1 Tax=Hoeflea sp. IMCC20628 TaxID=1620421 RepID=UPI00063AF15B|nr:hypothetical protein [Hoeflea sp. IMCC20628]AKI01630.1 hypothetical protein IMCC20628_02936 [Hoeflea sp. IMCC20628]